MQLTKSVPRVRGDGPAALLLGTGGRNYFPPARRDGPAGIPKGFYDKLCSPRLRGRSRPTPPPS
ncbi:hypothetical protein [Streptomyces sp. NPDC039028]|uniref:hypothetical protein n=1 Tax=unclassified Streptomyces TaxID=2593676 RepID=UPI0033FB0AE4